MLNTTHATAPATAADLVRQFLTAGFRPGKPPGLPLAALALDLRTYGRMRCARCRRRLTPRAWTNGTAGGYRLLCSCTPGCGYGCEA